jgi:ribosomal protein L30/L7E
MFTPSTMRARASPPKITSFAAMLGLQKYQKKIFVDEEESVASGS